VSGQYRKCSGIIVRTADIYQRMIHKISDRCRRIVPLTVSFSVGK
jgi:hypothetical protein